jgi:predicted anti-sigma-YlaC factor YlaD
MMKQNTFQRLKTAIISWLARRLSDCKTITPILGESLDRKLSLREKIKIKLHLFTCRACTNYFKEIKFLREAVRASAEKMAQNENSTAAKLGTDAKERLKNALRSTENFSF